MEEKGQWGARRRAEPGWVWYRPGRQAGAWGRGWLQGGQEALRPDLPLSQVGWPA